MGLRYNPFTGSFDLTRSPGSYLDGEVATYGDLPLDTAAAPLNSAWLVRGASGLWLLSRKPAGIYIRTATTGDRDADYTYAGTFPDVFSDANFVVYNDADSTKNVKLDASALTTGTTRTLTVPDASGTIATTSDLPDDYTVVSTAGNLANGDRVAANTTSAAFTLTLPASPANGDTIYVLDYAGTFASNNLTIGRNGNNIESLAEDLVCNVEKAAFSLVYAGGTVGWKVVPQTAQMPSTALANTWQVNQTFEGTNNTAPNQTAASGSSILTRDLGDKRLLAAPIFYTGGMLVNMGLSNATIDGVSPQFSSAFFSGGQCANGVVTVFRIPCPDFIAGRSVTVTSYWGPRNLSATTGNIHIRTFFVGDAASFQTTLQEISSTGLGLAADLKTVTQTFTATASLPSGVFNHLIISRRATEANDTWEAGVTMWGVKLELA